MAAGGWDERAVWARILGHCDLEFGDAVWLSESCVLWGPRDGVLGLRLRLPLAVAVADRR